MLSTSLLKKISLLILGLVFVSSLTIPAISNAAYKVIDPGDNGSCSRVLVIFARGSGQNGYGTYRLTDSYSNDADVVDDLNNIYASAGVNSTEKQTATFFAEFHKRIPTGVQYMSLHDIYGRYNSRGYVAVGVPGGFTQKPTHRKDVANRYYESVKDGAEELAWYLEDQLTSCPLQRVVLAGYSQGAEVVTDGVNILQPQFRSRIAYMALYGDPHFNPYQSLVPPIRGWWARGNATLTHGILGSHTPYIPSGIIAAGSWCQVDDTICDGGPIDNKTPSNYFLSKIGDDQHSDAYQDKWIPKSMPEIVRAVHNVVPSVPDNTSSVVYVNKGDKLWNLDLAIVIDNSAAMASNLGTIKGNAASLSTELLSSYSKARVGIVTYGGSPQNYQLGTDDYSNLVMPLTDNSSTLRRSILGISARQPFTQVVWDTTTQSYQVIQLPEYSAQYDGIMRAINDLDWEHGAQKKILVITNNQARNPDPSPNHWTEYDVQRAAYNLDPAGLNLANVSCGTDGSCDYSVDQAFQALADGSGGEIGDINLSFGTIDDLNDLLDEIQTQPTASLGGDQTGYTGTPVNITADESYDPNSALTEYDWDCAGDGTYEASTAWPTYDCTYAQPGDYTVGVRIWSDDGQSAQAIWPVHILPGPAPAIPAAPATPNVKLSYESDGLQLTWDNTYDTNVYIRVADDQDNLIGYAPTNAESIKLAGVGSEMPELHVSACTNTGGCSTPAILLLDSDALTAMVSADNADPFTVQASAQTSATTPAHTTLVTTASAIIKPLNFAGIIQGAPDSVLGDSSAPSQADQLPKTTTPSQTEHTTPWLWWLIAACGVGVLLPTYYLVEKRADS